MRISHHHCKYNGSLNDPISPPQSSSAIEEELEVLYDAYYDELEQYANYQQRYHASGGTIPPPPGPGPFPGSVELDKNGAVVSPAPVPRRARKTNTRRAAETEYVGQEEGDGEEEDEYEDEEEYEDEDEEEQEEDDDEGDDIDDPAHPQATPPSSRSRGTFNFGSSLAVTGMFSFFRSKSKWIGLLIGLRSQETF